MNGYQQYLKRMLKVVPLEIEASQKMGFNLGIKLIRGAYMNEERSLAQQGCYESPVHETIENTHECYNRNLKILASSLKAKDRLFIGSHNLESVELAKQCIQEYNLNDGRVSMAQLKGFSDQITGTLANEGYQVYKYLPYGPTDTVMPYLVRRGQESRQVLREQKFQNEFLKAEIYRRITLGNYA